MAITQTDLDNLAAAIVSGQLTVEYNGRRVTYRSMAEMKQAYGFAQQLLAGSGGADSSTGYASFQTDEVVSPTGLDSWVPGGGLWL